CGFCHRLAITCATRPAFSLRLAPPSTKIGQRPPTAAPAAIIIPLALLFGATIIFFLRLRCLLRPLLQNLVSRLAVDRLIVKPANRAELHHPAPLFRRD